MAPRKKKQDLIIDVPPIPVPIIDNVPIIDTVPVKRGRKKKIVIDTTQLINNDTLVPEYNKKQEQDLSKYSNQRQISIGTMNVVVHTANTNKNSDIRKLLESDQQHSSVLIQDKKQKEKNDISNIPDIIPLNNNESTLIMPIVSSKVKNIKQESKDIKDFGIDSRPNPLLRKVENIVKILDTTDKRTGICCFWCCHTFDGPNIPRPVSYDKLSKMFNVEEPCIYKIVNYRTWKNI